ncbi:carbohydrate porin [Rhodovibrionaceae bacterium A322]
MFPSLTSQMAFRGLPRLRQKIGAKRQTQVSRLFTGGALAMAICLVAPVSAQESNRSSRSNYQDVPGFGGPSSVGAELVEDDSLVGEVPRFESLNQSLKPWFDWKDKLHKDTGLALGIDYSALGQVLSSSPEDRSAVGGVFRTYGNWTLLDLGEKNTGSLVFKLENRHRLGTDLSPQSLGFVAGSGLPTGTLFSDYGWGVTNLYWQQKALNGRLTVLAGKVDPTDYVDIYGLTNPLTHFQNLAFLTDPTIAVPDQGLGLAAGVMLTDNLYAIGGFSDANGDPTKAGVDSFFQDREYFSHGEFGWTPAQDQIYLTNIHATIWHSDAREASGTPSGKGIALSASTFIDGRWMPFVRAGWSEGGASLMERSLSLGLGHYFDDSKDVMAAGLNWARPSGSSPRDQMTAEIFYRWQFAQSLAITPDAQLIYHPSNAPDKTWIGVLGLRARLSL